MVGKNNTRTDEQIVCLTLAAVTQNLNWAISWLLC